MQRFLSLFPFPKAGDFNEKSFPLLILGDCFCLKKISEHVSVFSIITNFTYWRPRKTRTKKTFPISMFENYKSWNIKTMLYSSISMHNVIKIPAELAAKVIEKLSRLVKLNFCGFARNSWILNTKWHCRNRKLHNAMKIKEDGYSLCRRKKYFCNRRAFRRRDARVLVKAQKWLCW